MALPLCLIHANCQGDTLHGLLASTPAFAREYEIKKYTNYLKEEIPSEDLACCALLLYQHMDTAWGEHGHAPLLARLPASANALKIPNMFFNGYWPLWTNSTHMAYGDELLEHLAAQGLSPGEILHIYMYGNLTAKYDLAARIEASRQREEVKEAGAVVRTLDIIDELWRSEQLFYTVNHPMPRLSLHVADGVLRELGLGSVPPTVRAALHALEEEFAQPLHPQVGKALGLPFAAADRRYPVYGQRMTFAEYAAAYVACRLQPPDVAGEMQDFVVYLHVLAQQMNSECP